MEQIKWIWGEEKAKANFIKHEITFSEAALVFEDPLHASRPDPHPDGDRWQTIGRVGPFLVFVVHTLPVKWESEAALIGRIISARITTSFERRAYEDGDF
ncbi:MAG: BrnT family toxin [Terracidiphilus sp.]|jgi:hypothetical protein